jgi:hypothetical protein
MLLLLQQTDERILVTVVVLRVVCVWLLLFVAFTSCHPLGSTAIPASPTWALEGQSQGAVPVELPESTHGATDTKEGRVVRKLPQLHNP